MPIICNFQCDKCGFSLPSGSGGHMYVTDYYGERIVCPHPNEFDKVREILGADAPSELIEQKTGFNSYCLCLDCLAEVTIDLARDARTCPKCKSGRVSSVIELVGASCPKCKVGTIQEIDTGICT
jgi:hypothetical protein